MLPFRITSRHSIRTLLIVLSLMLLVQAMSSALPATRAGVLQQAATATPFPTAINGGTYTLIDDQAGFALGAISLEIDSNGRPVLIYDSSFGLRIVRCQDISCQSRTTADIFIRGLLDFTLDDQDRVVFTYVVGQPTTGGAGPVYLARCQDLNCTSYTSIQVDPSNVVPFALNILEVNSNDVPYIAYSSDNPGGTKLGRCLTPACTQVITEPVITVNPPLDLFALQLDSNDVPVIAYANGPEVRLVRCASSTSCAGATSQLIGPMNVTGIIPLDMVLDDQDRPHILYQNTAGMVLAECADVGCTAGTVIRVLDASPGMRGWDGGIALGPNGEQFIGYDRMIPPVAHTYLMSHRCQDGICSGRNLALLSSTNPNARFGDIVYTNGTLLIAYYDDFTSAQWLSRLWLFSEPGSYPTPTPSATWTLTYTPSATYTPSHTPTITPSSPAEAAPQRNRFDDPEVALSWLPSSNAAFYELQIARDGAFSQLVFADSAIPGAVVNLTTPALPDGVYYWRVRARFMNGVTTGWSTVDSFAVVGATATASPTITLTPSLTPSLTLTLTPSLTASHTLTRTPTPTATSTLTPTMTFTYSGPPTEPGGGQT